MKKRAIGREFNMRKSDGVRVDHEKESDGLRVYHEKKSDRMKVHHNKERWAETSP